MKKWLIAAISSVIILPALAMSWKHLEKVWATPEKVDKIEVQTVQIGKWVEAQEKSNELKKKAPDGWMWSEKEEKYIPDPSYKKK